MTETKTQQQTMLDRIRAEYKAAVSLRESERPQQVALAMGDVYDQMFRMAKKCGTYLDRSVIQAILKDCKLDQTPEDVEAFEAAMQEAGFYETIEGGWGWCA